MSPRTWPFRTSLTRRPRTLVLQRSPSAPFATSNSRHTNPRLRTACASLRHPLKRSAK